ncbi:MAG: YqiJ family protein [Sandarakinorhabdus sp.]|nr:YqiJ family protein [Sandarakinorhabdus sp.]
MIEFLVQSGTAPFTVAILLMILLGIVEAVGLGSSAVDLDSGDIGEIGGALDWLNIGRLPLLMLLVVFLTVFGLAGLILQALALAISGGLLPWFGAVPAAIGVAAPVTRVLGAGLARILPRDETTAVDIDSLVGRRARIVIGTARRGHPARARVEDRFGHTHHVMVEPTDDASFTEAAMLLITARQGDTFHAVEIPADIFSIIRPTP